MAKSKGNISIEDLSGINRSKEGQIVVDELKLAHRDEFDMCADDFWYFAQYLWTYDEENELERPFPTQFPYLHKYHEEVQNHQKTITCKSRRLVVTWYWCARQLWRGKHAATRTGSEKQVFKGALFSIGELEAIELMGRVQFMHDKLPDWMKARNPMVVRNQLYSKFANGGSSQAFPLKREGPRSFGFTEAFFDEMAFQEAVRGVWTGLAPTLGAKGKLGAVSTPNGRGNLFYDIWSNKNGSYKDIHRITLNWWENPEHDKSWRNSLAASMDDRMIARELELSFAAQGGDPVWSEYSKMSHVNEEVDFVDGKAIYLGWDLGYHYPACVVAQHNSHDQLCCLLEFQGEDILFEDFCKEVKTGCEGFYDRSKTPEIHFVPPDGFKRTPRAGKTGAITDVQDIQNVFIHPLKPRVQVRQSAQDVGTRNNEGTRLKETRKLFKLRADGQPGILFHPRCEILTEGCGGGYCYPELKGMKSLLDEEPMKNEYSHTQDCVQAIVTGYNKLSIGADAKKRMEENKLLRKRGRIGHRTGL